MRDEEFKESHKERRHRGDGSKRKDHHHGRGAKTFRRGRAIAFLEMMNLKRSTLMQQLNAPEFQSINQIIVGELKAIDLVINEFIKLFEIHESEMMENNESADKANETIVAESNENDDK